MLSLIKNQSASLSPAEQRVAKWIIANPQATIQLPIASIADAAAVSEPTVVRFSRSLGCRGIKDLKVRLAQSLASGKNTIHTDVSIKDSFHEIIHKVVSSGVSELYGVRDQLNTRAIEQAVNNMKGCKQILFYGVGSSGIVAADARHKFFRLGIPCTAYTDIPTILQSAAISSADNVIVIISKTGNHTKIIRAAELARNAGACIITITTPHSSLENRASIAIKLNSDEDTNIYTPMSSRLAQLVILDILQVSLAVALGEEANKKLTATKNALRFLKDDAV